jgi:long-chain acyl-CoA synthetase
MSEAVAKTPAEGTSADTESLRRTLPGRLIHLARSRPDTVALREKRLGLWQEIPWKAYLDTVAAVGNALDHAGVGPGDHVAILSDNRPEWLYADLGAQGIGARSVGIYQTNPAEDVAYVLDHSGAKILFCEDQEQVDKAVAIADRTPSVRRVVVFETRGTRGYADDRLVSWREFLDEGHRLHQSRPDWFESRVAALDPDAPAMVVYTSGTTGNPKGALLTSTNVCAPADATFPILGVTEHEQVLSYLPLCHVAEKIFSLFLPLTAGATVHFGESIETVQDDLREVSPTIFLGVPRIWEKMAAKVDVKMRDASWLKRSLYRFFALKGRVIAEKRLAGRLGLLDRLLWLVGDLLVYRPLQERLGLRRCRLPISGAAPISPELILWFHGLGIPILEGFGQTECAGVSHANRPDAVKVGTVGQVVPGAECRLADDGEIIVRGPIVFPGYLHDPDATAKTVDAEGWLHTGDVGTIDADGYLSITGRKKEILVTSGGKNLSPEKIENVVKASPYIKEVVALGDGRNYVTALVQIELDTVGDWASRKKIPYTSYEDLAARPEVRELMETEIAAANARLARVETIRRFEILPRALNQDEGELTPTQKVRRKVVMERYAELIEGLYRRKAE